MQHENIYALAHGPEDAPTFFYAGKTVHPIAARFAGHVKGMRNPLDNKPAYEYARHVGIDNVRIVLLDTTASGLTERDYVTQLIRAGYPMTNANQGNAKVAKKRTNTEFSTLNKKADERLNAIERQNRLHNESQVLSKPEIVRQRVLGTICPADVLASLDWRSTAPELMRWGRPIKNPESIDCQLLKFGDYTIFVAFTKGKWAYWCKCTRDNTADAYKVNWRTAPNGFGIEEACQRIVQDWPSFTWWPLGKS